MTPGTAIGPDGVPTGADGSDVDVVIPLGSGSVWDDNNELRYCLRALEQNFLDLRHIFVVGTRPGWLNELAVHIPAEDVYRHNKDANIIRKILLACGHPDMSSAFVRCSDDELFIKPTRFADMCAFQESNLRRIRRHHQKLWRMRLQRTSSYLESKHMQSGMFDVHAPVPMDTQRFQDVMAEAPYQDGVGLCVDSLYFNMDTLRPRRLLDGQLARLRTPQPSAQGILEQTRGARFLNFNNDALNDTLRNHLQDAFNRPSRFER